VQKFDVPLPQETTLSFAVRKAFSLGLKTERQWGALAALPFDQHALELNPNFVTAIESVGIAYSNFGQADRGNEYPSRAFQRRNHASEREKLYINAQYYLNVMGNLERAAEALQKWELNYPRDDIAVGNLGLLYCQLGHWERATQETHKSIRLDPHGVIGHENLMQTLLALDRYDDLRKTYALPFDAPNRLDPCSLPCDLRRFWVRLSYHGDQDFNERAGCCPQPYPAKTEPSARRFAGGKTRRPTHCPDSAKIPSAKRANHSGSSDRPAGSQRRPQCTPANQCTDP
jgi:tetratricopeptide (TPR) repeat protein